MYESSSFLCPILFPNPSLPDRCSSWEDSETDILQENSLKVGLSENLSEYKPSPFSLEQYHSFFLSYLFNTFSKRPSPYFLLPPQRQLENNLLVLFCIFIAHLNWEHCLLMLSFSFFPTSINLLNEVKEPCLIYLYILVITIPELGIDILQTLIK